MLDHNTYGHIEAHYEHACNKHPHFCDEIIKKSTDEKEWWTLTLSRIRADLDTEVAASKTCAETILACELAELFSAIATKADNAIDEAYDAIAVLLRIIDELKKRENPNESI